VQCRIRVSHDLIGRFDFILLACRELQAEAAMPRSAAAARIPFRIVAENKLSAD